MELLSLSALEVQMHIYGSCLPYVAACPFSGKKCFHSIHVCLPFYSLFQFLINALLSSLFQSFNFFSDLSNYRYENCSELASRGIFVNGEYLLEGQSSPTKCILWGKEGFTGAQGTLFRS